MVNYTEILRLGAEGRSQRQIAASVRSSRNTVSEVIIAAQTNGITWPFEKAVSFLRMGGLFRREYSMAALFPLNPVYGVRADPQRCTILRYG